MGRAPCYDKIGLKKGPWTPDEDKLLISHIQKNGHDNWRALPKLAGLLRCGKSCRLRWINYLRPDIRRGNFTQEEEETIIKLHKMLGNRWSAIAARLPGRTDNEIKNVWHTHLKKKLRTNPNNCLHAKHQLHKLAAKSEPSYDTAAPDMANGSADTPTSTLASSEGTSVSDLSTATADVCYLDIKSEEMEPIQIPVIDESFWSDDLDSFSVMGHNLLNDSPAYNFSAPIDKFKGMEPGYVYSDLLINCYEGSLGQSVEENADFWYDLLISTRDVYEEGNGSTLLRDL